MCETEVVRHSSLLRSLECGWARLFAEAEWDGREGKGLEKYV